MRSAAVVNLTTPRELKSEFVSEIKIRYASHVRN
jgi:hypothetical protein